MNAKWMTHPIVSGAGVSFVCCFTLVEPFVSPSHDWIYHDRYDPARVILPVLFILVLVWFLSSLLLLVARRHSRIKTPVWSLLILIVAWRLLEDFALLVLWTPLHRAGPVIFLSGGTGWAGLMLLWRRSWQRPFLRVQRFTRSMLSCAALCGVLAAVQFAFGFTVTGSRPSSQRSHNPSGEVAQVVRGTRPRVVWIILDELSYQQVYERRFPDLELPAFDLLARQSAVFTRVRPAAVATELAVPSILTGSPVDRIRVGADGMLQSLHDPDSDQWFRFRQQDTVFQDALDRGYHTAAAGWYNPYCRILPEVLDRCQWSFRELSGGMVSDASVLKNTEAPWFRFLSRLGGLRPDRGWTDELAAEVHIADYRDIVSAGDRFLQDSSIDFLLLHAPVPHPGGIYDRRTRTFTTHRSSYVDNLALADAYLAHVRQILQQRGEWDSSAIVVMGDHSWRTQLLWRSSALWTAEDEAASQGGQYDERPAYIVKLPHQEEEVQMDRPFEANQTRALLQGIFAGRIRTVPDLAAFAGQGKQQEVAASTPAADAGSGCHAQSTGRALPPPGCGPRAPAGRRP